MPAKLYDWEKWFAASWFTLYKGKDYKTNDLSMAQQLRNAAKGRGLTIHITCRDWGLEVRTEPRPSPRRKRRRARA